MESGMNSSPRHRRGFKGQLLINSRLQLSLLASIWLVVAIGMVVAALASAYWFAFSVEPTRGAAISGWQGWYGRIALAVLGLLGLMVWISLILTQRMAGPVYRIMRRLESMATGDLDQSMRLRRKDEFQELAEQLNVTIESLRQERERARRKAAQLADELERLRRNLPLEAASGESGESPGAQALERASAICSELTGQIQLCERVLASRKDL